MIGMILMMVLPAQKTMIMIVMSVMENMIIDVFGWQLKFLKAILWMFHALESAERLNMAERSQLFLTLIHFKQKQKNTQIPFAACKLTPDALLCLILR